MGQLQSTKSNVSLLFGEILDSATGDAFTGFAAPNINNQVYQFKRPPSNIETLSIKAEIHSASLITTPKLHGQVYPIETRNYHRAGYIGYLQNCLEFIIDNIRGKK